MSQTRNTTTLLNQALNGADLKIDGNKKISDGHFYTGVGATTLGAVGYFAIHAILVSNPVTVGFVFGEIVGGAVGLLVTTGGISDIKRGLTQVMTGNNIIEHTKVEAKRLEDDAQKTQTNKPLPITSNVVMFTSVTPVAPATTTEKPVEVTAPKANMK